VVFGALRAMLRLRANAWRWWAGGSRSRWPTRSMGRLPGAADCGQQAICLLVGAAMSHTNVRLSWSP